MSELNMCINILTELKDMEEKELEDKLRGYVKKYKKVSVKEKLGKNISKKNHDSFVCSGIIFTKEKLSYLIEDTSKSYIEILSDNYNKEFMEYENLLYIKFIRLKLYLLKKGQERYFNNLIEIIKLYSNTLSKGLEITSQFNLKQKIDEIFYSEIIKAKNL